MNMERDMDAVTGGPWREHTYDRQGWHSKLATWVEQRDLPWASMRQPSLTYTLEPTPERARVADLHH